MTPTERAKAYWLSQQHGDGTNLAEVFKLVHNEAIEQAAKRIMHSQDRAAVLRMKYFD